MLAGFVQNVTVNKINVPPAGLGEEAERAARSRPWDLAAAARADARELLHVRLDVHVTAVCAEEWWCVLSLASVPATGAHLARPAHLTRRVERLLTATVIAATLRGRGAVGERIVLVLVLVRPRCGAHISLRVGMCVED